MSFEPDSMQRLLLWRLAVSSQGGEFLGKIEATISPARRRPLIANKLIEERKQRASPKQRPAIYLELTDGGWAWCQNHLADDLAIRGQTPKLAGRVLQELFGLLSRYLTGQEHTTSIGQFVLQSRSVSIKPAQVASTTSGAPVPDDGTSSALSISSVGDQPAPDRSDIDTELPQLTLRNEVRRACLDLGDGRQNVRVRLADLRSRLLRVTRDELNATILELEREGGLTLFRLDNPQEIQPEDRDAAIRTATGFERHILYFGGRTS